MRLHKTINISTKQQDSQSPKPESKSQILCSAESATSGSEEGKKYRESALPMLKSKRRGNLPMVHPTDIHLQAGNARNHILISLLFHRTSAGNEIMTLKSVIFNVIHLRAHSFSPGEYSPN
jgi:hypothetical protein